MFRGFGSFRRLNFIQEVVMPLIQWSDALSVNVKEIDLQHQKLVGMINDLNDAMREGKGKEVLGKTINELVSYAAAHFRLEEKYFDQYSYPETAAHKMEHTAFVQKVTEFKSGFDKGTLGLSMQVMGFLSDWLQKHIKGNDKKYSAFFNSKGLK